MTAPARRAALRALSAIADARADLPAALAHTRDQLPDQRDRALTAAIVTGTLRWQRALDHLIEHFAERPLRRIDSDIVAILRLSLYQILHLERVPTAAVVDDAVDLTRVVRKTSAAGFVNAVLRATLRQRDRLPLPSRPTAPPRDRAGAIAYLGITYSHPEWLVTRWLDRHGFEATERWVRFNNDTPLLTLRANRLRGTREAVAAGLAADGIETTPARHAPDGLIVTAGNPLSRPADGSFVVQDEASQLVTLAVSAQPDERILDLCASPGGKTTAMAADMRDSGTMVACDVRRRRVKLLQETVEASGATRVRIVQVAATATLPFASAFDRVLVDAPCSGLGTIRRDPDLRWRRAEADLAVLARTQVELLSRAAEVVRRGGRLVYATCSSEPEENEAVIDAFMARWPEFQVVDLRQSAATPLAPFLDQRGMMRTLPFEHDLEAFFAAALVRRSRTRDDVVNQP